MKLDEAWIKVGEAVYAHSDCSARHALMLVRGDVAELKAINDDLLAACKEACEILWMAEKYAEGGGDNSIEMQTYTAAASVIRAAVAKAEKEVRQ